MNELRHLKPHKFEFQEVTKFNPSHVDSLYHLNLPNHCRGDRKWNPSIDKPEEIESILLNKYGLDFRTFQDKFVIYGGFLLRWIKGETLPTIGVDVDIHYIGEPSLMLVSIQTLIIKNKAKYKWTSLSYRGTQNTIEFIYNFGKYKCQIQFYKLPAKSFDEVVKKIDFCPLVYNFAEKCLYTTKRGDLEFSLGGPICDPRFRDAVFSYRLFKTARIMKSCYFYGVDYVPSSTSEIRMGLWKENCIELHDHMKAFAGKSTYPKITNDEGIKEWIYLELKNTCSPLPKVFYDIKVWYQPLKMRRRFA